MNIMKKVSIYIATHKKFDEPKNGIYIPLHVGATGKEDLKYKRDDSGENISFKNKNFCELTGLYWIWKNDTSDIVGLVHYRRYFYNMKMINKKFNILRKDKIIKILSKNDIIVPKIKKIDKISIINHYDRCHYKKDLLLCRDVLIEKYPDYVLAYDNFISQNKMHLYNMIITKKEIFDEYCSWLFDILFEVEKRTNITNYNEYNKRIYGFLSERLFNIWLLKNNKYKVKQINVYNSEDKMLNKLVNRIIKRG